MVKIVSLGVGEPRTLGQSQIVSSIGRLSPSEKLVIHQEGIEGHRIHNEKFHGGLDRILHQYPFEHYEFFGAQYRREFLPLSFGENLCSIGILERDVRIGDIYQMGSVLLQVTEPRKPCCVIDIHTGCEGLFKEIERSSRCGWFYRVLREGVIDRESQIKLMEQGDERFDLVQVMKQSLSSPYDLDYLQQLYEVKALSMRWRQRIRQRLKASRF